MSQPFVLPANPSFGTQLAQQLGQGFGKGLEKGIGYGLQGMLKQKKEAGKLRSSINQLSKRYEKGAFSPDQLNAFEIRANDFIKQGYSAADASLMAFQESQQKSGLEALNEPEKKKRNIRIRIRRI